MKEKKFRVISGGVTASKGFKACGATTGLKPNNRLDIALIESEVEAIPAIVTTQNAVKAAPVLWDNQIVKKDKSTFTKFGNDLKDYGKLVRSTGNNVNTMIMKWKDR